jgi:Glycine-zipper domain
MNKLLLLAAVALPVAACADMNPTQQRALTGTAIGAGGGAVIGAIGGNAALGAGIGAGAGLLGGLLVDRSRQAQDAAFQEGFAAGQSRR